MDELRDVVIEHASADDLDDDGNKAARLMYEQLGFRATSIVLTRDLP